MRNQLITFANYVHGVSFKSLSNLFQMCARWGFGDDCDRCQANVYLSDLINFRNIERADESA
jgi:hypothetical protein